MSDTGDPISIEEYFGIRDGKRIDRANGHVNRDQRRVDHIVERVQMQTRRGRRWRQRDLTEGAARPKGDGSRLITSAMFGLFILGVGLLSVSVAAQYRYVLAERHQVTASMIEALSADIGLCILSLLALGLARRGLKSGPERWGVVGIALLSAGMNFAAADSGSWRSVLAFCAPPIFLAFVVDRTVSTIRRHLLGMTDDRSAFAVAGAVLLGVLKVLGVFLLYLLRLVLSPIETPRGLRQMVLNAVPLPEKAVKVTVVSPSKNPKSINPPSGKGSRGSRANSKKARFLAEVERVYGPLGQIDLPRAYEMAKEIAPTIPYVVQQARNELASAIVAARNGGARS
jgi:hypothetical protein